MEIIVCIKRVPAPGTRIVLSTDEKKIVTRNIGFTMSPHEECAVEEAVRLKEKHGGRVTVLTLGPELATEQLRQALAVGADEAILLKTDGRDWDPMATSRAIANVIKERSIDLLLFGNESADAGGFQVGIRVAHALDIACISGAKSIEINEGKAFVQREASNGWELYELALPAVISVKEGINLPRYPSLPGRMRARRRSIDQEELTYVVGGPEMIRLKLPEEQESNVKILGHGKEAVPKILELMKDLRFLD